MRRFITFGPALVVLLTAVVTLVAAPAAVRMVSYANTDATMQLARQTLDQDNVLKQIDRAVRAIAEAVEPSVVHIAINEPMTRGMYRMQRVSQGSGWVYDADGHIVTNSHVVSNSRAMEVTFQDGRVVPAELVGRDPSTDIAVIRVKTTEGLFPARRASEIELHQGERVYAFGSPFGFKFSMSEGIVSGLGRDPQRVLGEGGYTNFIQTDAAVNPGNSGGPLVNVEGKVVGMNVAIATAANSEGTAEVGGQNSGISFAIPLVTIESVVDQLIATGQVQRGYLGITHVGLEDRNQQELLVRNITARGVFVSSVESGGPADRAGLKPGDVITRINGRPTPTIAVFRSAVITIPPGERATVEVYRDGRTTEIPVNFGELIIPTEVEIREARAALQRFGLLRLSSAENGAVLVTEMIRGSPAMRLGIRPGSVITQADQKPIASFDDLLLAVSRPLAQGRPVTVTVTDGYGEERQVEIDPVR